jgi:hypothetical protein
MSNYGREMDKLIDNYFDFYGLNRVVFGGNVTSGYRIINGLYVVGTFIYTRDMIWGFSYDTDIHAPALLAGVRWYPLESHRFLQIGFDLGPSWLSVESKVPNISRSPAIGLGINTTWAIDFKNTRDEFPLLLGWNFLYSYIKGDSKGGSVFTPGIFAKFVYKRTKNIEDEDFDINDASIAAGIIWPVMCFIATWIVYNMIPSSNRS